MALPGWFKHILQHYGVDYEVHYHPTVYTASRLAQVEHVSGYRVAKPVYMVHRGRPVAVVVPSCAHLDVERVRAVLGGDDLRLATEPEMARWFKGCQPGAVPPLRLRSDERILMDRSLAHVGKILFAACTLELAVAMHFRDWYRTVRPGVGRFIQEANGHSESNGLPIVLVVEDETDTNELLCSLLEREGFACEGVAEGVHALAKASQVRPAAILLDLMLPDMSGFEVCERLRTSGPLKHTPVIMVTALDDEASRQRGRQLGADAFLTKPFLPETLVKELQGAVADARV
jgi:CheY-like chemotaxis protein